MCKGPLIDMYYDDAAENEDTQYVLKQLCHSKDCLKVKPNRPGAGSTYNVIYSFYSNTLI